MAFNATRWKNMGRNWGRGDPPPVGSIEYVAVGDMFYGVNQPKKQSERQSSESGKVLEIGFTEIDAADRWLAHIYENLKYARKVHGKKVITDDDIKAWDAFIVRWKEWRYRYFLGFRSKELETLAMMSVEEKRKFDALLDESKSLHDRFIAKGMATVPVPYMGELVLLLRTMPKKITAADMYAKLEAGIKCGKMLLAENTAWWQWKKRDDTRGLVRAVEEATNASRLYARSSTADAYGPGDPAYDEFLRRLTKIYIEAAGLYGIVEVKKTAAAEAKDVAAEKVSDTGSSLLYLLLMAGVSYLGLRWLTRDTTPKVVVAVPNAGSHEDPREEG